MQPVSIDNANPETGEDTFILKLSLPSASNGQGGALMEKMGQFVELFLSQTEPTTARFAQMGGNTWVIAAAVEDADALEQSRVGLAESLYGEDDGQKVELEWPFGVAPSAPEHDLADNAADHTEDDAADATGDDDDWTLADTAPAGPIAATDSQTDPIFESDSVDLDALEASEIAPEDANLSAQLEDARAVDERTESDASGDDVFVIDDLNIGSADEMAETVMPASDAMPDQVDPASPPPGEDGNWDLATAAQRAAFDDESDVFEVDAFDIDIVDPDGEVEARPGTADAIEPQPPEPPVFADAPEGPVWGEPNVTDKAAPECLEALTEAPERPRKPDLAGELSAFRAEMRQIAASIPGSGDGDMLAEFRAELDAISGAMGQRVDGAAQRIEAAASEVVEATSRMDATRLSEAADRAERSAHSLETGVAEALSALNAAVKAMSGEDSAPTSDAAS